MTQAELDNELDEIQLNADQWIADYIAQDPHELLSKIFKVAAENRNDAIAVGEHIFTFLVTEIRGLVEARK